MFECVESVQNVRDLGYVGFVYMVHECTEKKCRLFQSKYQIYFAMKNGLRGLIQSSIYR